MKYFSTFSADEVRDWNNYINSCIESFLRSQSEIDSSILSSSENDNESYFYSHICGQNRNWNENRSFNLRTDTNSTDLTLSDNDLNENDPSKKVKKDLSENDLSKKVKKDLSESANDLGRFPTFGGFPKFSGFPKLGFSGFQKYKHLWVQCEICYGLNYKKFLKSRMYICEQCGYHLKMSSSDRIELSIDPGTWNPMDEDMLSLDLIKFYSEEELSNSDLEKEPYNFDSAKEPRNSDSAKGREPYKNPIHSYQKKTGFTDAIQTGIGRLNGIPVAIGVMEFQFIGGSMGSVVGEKITRLIEYAANQFLPLILVCTSGGARMQEGSLSLMQMAKISSALYDYQSNKKLLYISILTSPTTGGVTASFGMLGDIIIAEPQAYIAFAGKRVIEQTLNVTVPEGSQETEFLFEKGLFDLIVPRNPLKSVLAELFQLHAFFPLNHN